MLLLLFNEILDCAAAAHFDIGCGNAHFAARLSRLRIQNTNPVLSFYAQLLQRVGDVCTVHTSIQPSIQAQWKERLRVVTTELKSSVERTTSFSKNYFFNAEYLDMVYLTL